MSNNLNAQEDSLKFTMVNEEKDSYKNSLQQTKKEMDLKNSYESYIDSGIAKNACPLSKSAFSVAVRFRPTVCNEIGEVENNSIWELSQKSIYDVSKKTHYYFDYVFNEKSTNYLIYDKLIKDAVKTCLSGINVTIFAYGQTSSGKTHTMFGDNKGSYDGVVPLSINEIFNLACIKHIHSDYKNNKIIVSYLEVYNEKLFDLLAPQSNLNNNFDNNSKKIKVIDGVDGAVDFLNLTTRIVSSPEDVHAIIKTGLKSRRTAETNMNERSSRSHTILRIKIESQMNSNEVRVGVLNFVDLAGSESIKRTQLEGDRRKEGMSINRSLLALSQVISQLSENKFVEPLSINSSNQTTLADGPTQSKNKYINYRDSKITRILSDSLGGNSRTIIICNCSPDRINYYETLSTIDFARRAKKIQNKVKVNILKSNEEKSEIVELKQKIINLSKKVEGVNLLKQEIELLKNEKAELLFELNKVKLNYSNCHSKLTDLDFDSHNFCKTYKEQFDHLLAEYAEIIDLKDQNIKYLNEEINSLKALVRSAEKIENDNCEMKIDIDIKNNKLIGKEIEIKNLSTLLSESNNKLCAFQAQLDCKDSVIESLICKNEKISIRCFELEKRLEYSLLEIYRFINWYINDLNSKKLQKTELIKSENINENSERLFSYIKNYLDFISMYNQIIKQESLDYYLEFLNFKNEVLQLEFDLKHYEKERNRVDHETINCQKQTIQCLNSTVLITTELLCNLWAEKNNSNSTSDSLQNLSISDSYEFIKKVKSSERLIELLESELNEKKDLELKLKVLQINSENINSENIILNESLEFQKKENNELRVSLNKLKHELNCKFISNNNSHSQEIPHNSDVRVKVDDLLNINQSLINISNTNTDNISQKDKMLLKPNDLKENRSKENITNAIPNDIVKEKSEKFASNITENHISECNTQ